MSDSSPANPSDPSNDPIRAARDEMSGAEVAPNSAGEQPGDCIDRYKLLQEIGEGGMGTVWMAEQSEPVRRKVALKIIKLGMDTRDVVVRFEAERQALALMDHPHIAKVLDGGATETGRPFFVMELVKGIPITEFCDKSKLGLQQRLELFAKVCDALQHAHQKGVIHRDVKPSNVMVTLHDGVAVPKVIDFGIAKATSAELTQKTMFTQYAQMIGTPEYMAPEQAEMSGLDIDTRADVYSLGVLLYELLTGTTPFVLKDVLSRGYAELLRTIREDEPAKPSTRISTLGEAATPIAAARHVNVDRLSSRLRGDLDRIVMKALSKDRTLRYDTANSFADDIARYIRNEPVLAIAPSASYRLRKFVQRRKKTVLAGALIAASLVIGGIAAGLGWYEADRANDLLAESLRTEEAQRKLAVASSQQAQLAAQQAKAEAERATKAEALARSEAERAGLAERLNKERAEQLERIVQFQEKSLGNLDPMAFGNELRRQILAALPSPKRAELEAALREVNFTDIGKTGLQECLIEPTLAAIDSDFADVAMVRARLLQAVGRTQTELGLHEDAVPTARAALAIRKQLLGPEHEVTIDSMMLLSSALLLSNQIEEAVSLARDAVAQARASLGDDNLQKWAAVYHLGYVLGMGNDPEGLEPMREALAGFRKTVGERHEKTLLAMNGVVGLSTQLGKVREAESLARHALELTREIYGDRHLNVWTAEDALALVLMMRGSLREAEQVSSSALQGFRESLGNEHARTIGAMIIHARLLCRNDKLDAADRQIEEALRVARRAYGERGQLVRSALSTRIELERRRGVVGDDTGDDLARDVQERMKQATGGVVDANTLTLAVNRVTSMMRRSDLEAARELATKTHGQARNILGPDHPVTLAALTHRGVALQRLGKSELAAPILEDAARRARLKLGLNHEQTLAAMTSLGVALQSVQRHEEANKAFDEVYMARRDALGENHMRTQFAKLNVAMGLSQMGRDQEGLAMTEDILAAVQKVLGKRHEVALRVEHRLVQMQYGCGDLETAVSNGRRLLEQMRRVLRDHHHETQSLWSVMCVILQASGDAQGALEQHRERLEFFLDEDEERYAEDIAKAHGSIGTLLLELDQPVEAEKSLRTALATREEFLPVGHRLRWVLDFLRVQLAAAMGKQGAYAKADAMMRAALEVVGVEGVTDAPRGPGRDLPSEALIRGVEFYEGWQAADPAGAKGHAESANRARELLAARRAYVASERAKRGEGDGSGKAEGRGKAEGK